MRRVLVAQLGARRHYAVPRALAQMGRLECLVTDFCADIAPWRWVDAVFPVKARAVALRRLLGRRVPGVPANRIVSFPWFGLSAAWDRARGEAQTDYWARRNARFATLVARRGFGRADAVYCYNCAALEVLLAARARGLRAVLDQTAAPWRWNAALLREEALHWPGWEDAPSEIDDSGRLSAREEAEWPLADRIICGSAFAADALAEMGGPRDRCTVVPGNVGPTVTVADPQRDRRSRRDGPLRVLFVGTLQLRKGVPYLLEAQRRLRSDGVTTRVVGPSLLSERVMRDLRREMDVVGPVPRADMAPHYDWADIFVLPTLSEGSANVVYEAMAAGLPVVTTRNAGSLIQDGETGLLIPIRDAEALVQAIRRLAQDHALRYRLTAGRAAVPATATAVVGSYAARLVAAMGGA